MARRAHGLALVLALLLTPHDVRGQSPEVRIDGELGYEPRYFGSPGYATVGLGATTFAVSGALELSGGGRLAFGMISPNPGASGFLRASLRAAQRSYWPETGYWLPALGVELEATTVTRATWTDAEPPGSLTRAYAERDAKNTLRAALVIAPARWQWKHLFGAVGSLRLGTPLTADLGDRIYLTVFNVIGWGL